MVKMKWINCCVLVVLFSWKKAASSRSTYLHYKYQTQFLGQFSTNCTIKYKCSRAALSKRWNWFTPSCLRQGRAVYLSGQTVVLLTCRDEVKRWSFSFSADILLTSVQYCLFTTKGLLVYKNWRLTSLYKKPWYYLKPFFHYNPASVWKKLVDWHCTVLSQMPLMVFIIFKTGYNKHDVFYLGFHQFILYSIDNLFSDSNYSPNIFRIKISGFSAEDSKESY